MRPRTTCYRHHPRLQRSHLLRITLSGKSPGINGRWTATEKLSLLHCPPNHSSIGPGYAGFPPSLNALGWGHPNGTRAKANIRFKTTHARRKPKKVEGVSATSQVPSPASKASSIVAAASVLIEPRISPSTQSTSNGRVFHGRAKVMTSARSITTERVRHRGGLWGSYTGWKRGVRLGAR